MIVNEEETFCPADQIEWRNWLAENHQTKQSIWLVYFKMSSGKSTLTWSQAVDEALCFGWIDSTRKTRDAESFYQFFTRRKPKSNWSKINKAKIESLTAANKMAPAGHAVIEVAKLNGSWNILDEVEELTIPKDLLKALSARKGAKPYFLSLSKSVMKMMLYWVKSAKRPETRQKRIDEIADKAMEGLKPKQF